MICRNCGAGLEADGIDTSLGIVTCAHCGSLHDIPRDGFNMPTGKEAASEPSTKPERIEVPLPRKFNIRRNTGGLEISWSAGGVFPGIILSFMAGVFGFVAVTSGMWFLLIGSAWMFYFAATRAFNKHRLRVDSARLEVTQGPLPWPGSRRLDAADIVQLYATEHTTRNQSSQKGHNRRVNVRKHYRLSANTRSDGRIKVLSGLNDPLQALWLEQEIERLLGIVDTRVAGEYKL